LSKSPYRRHLIIPDTQCKPGAPTDHHKWVAQAVVDYQPDLVVHVGDNGDMPSLSQHDKAGSKKTEGARYEKDIEAANEFFETYEKIVGKEVKRQSRNKNAWQPEQHYLLGNHEHRITRAIENEPKFEGVISLNHLKSSGWKRHRFLEVVDIDGIKYSHYFQSSMSKFAIGGSIDNRLNKIGESFVQGHQQGMLYGSRIFPTGYTRHGLIAGSCYMHEEDYRGPQGQKHWRGVVVLNQVRDGDYDIMPLNLGYLCRKYEKMDLVKYMQKKYKGQSWKHLE
jgi:hypothetical protein